MVFRQIFVRHARPEGREVWEKAFHRTMEGNLYCRTYNSVGTMCTDQQIVFGMLKNLDQAL